MHLNENTKERKMGFIFMIIWFAVLLFYMTWDGWVYEWHKCGYAGPNQHFDFDFGDMVYTVVGNTILYASTNNLHNIIFLCYTTFLFGWIGLLTGSEIFKQGTMATLAFPVIAAMSTLNPIGDHVYIVQIVYDIVHLSGIIIGVYFMYHNDINTKKMIPIIMLTWVIYIVSRILTTPWPYWENDGLAYFSINQANDMPFYFYGLEYGIVVVIFLTVNFMFEKIGTKISNKHVKALFPLVIFFILCVVFLATGLIQITEIDLGTC